jgi:hypothetical protein
LGFSQKRKKTTEREREREREIPGGVDERDWFLVFSFVLYQRAFAVNLIQSKAKLVSLYKVLA